MRQRYFGRSLSDRDLHDMYDASLHPREERPSLNLLDRADAGRYLFRRWDSCQASAIGGQLLRWRRYGSPASGFPRILIRLSSGADPRTKS